MTITQRPQSVAFAADMSDYQIDSDASIAFAVKKGQITILNEEYSPDAAYRICTHQLGKFCADALWGSFSDDTQKIQSSLTADFSFDIEGKTDTSTFLVGSKYPVHYNPTASKALTLCKSKITRMAAKEWVSMLLEPDALVLVVVTDMDGGQHQKEIARNSVSRAVVTLDVSLERIAALFPGINILKYEVGGLIFRVDKTQYLEPYNFRYLNNFDCPEGVTATGNLVSHASDKSEDATMNGIDRRFRITPADEYTVNSGVIFAQEEYRCWRELLQSRRVQMRVDGIWYDVIITKSKFERNFRKNILKSVEFSFRFANSDDNIVL